MSEQPTKQSEGGLLNPIIPTHFREGEALGDEDPFRPARPVAIKPLPIKVAGELDKNMSDVAVRKIVEERAKVHGDFSEMARIGQDLKGVMRGAPGWQRLTDTQREALEMLAHKIGRILAGDPNHPDHWDDMGGYVMMALDRMMKS